MKTFCILVLLIGILVSDPLPFVSVAQPSRPERSGQKVPPELGEIVTTREQLRGFVLDIKEKFDSSDEQYKKMREFYRKATSEYRGWTIELEFAIEQGTAKDLRSIIRE